MSTINIHRPIFLVGKGGGRDACGNFQNSVKLNGVKKTNMATNSEHRAGGGIKRSLTEVCSISRSWRHVDRSRKLSLWNCLHRGWLIANALDCCAISRRILIVWKNENHVLYTNRVPCIRDCYQIEGSDVLATTLAQ